jgi:ABC-2 type transport system permease protein
MTAESTPVETPAAPGPARSRSPRSDAIPSRRERSVPYAGWMVIARKELGDHLLSWRFVILVLIVAAAALVPLYFAADALRTSASSSNQLAARFLTLFWYGPPVANGQVTLPSVAGFLSIVAPLLGVVFAFDAVNGERAQGTLPRLLSQPIHRDDVINGKLAAGLAVIGLVIVAVIGGIAAFGIVRIGIVPTAPELLRLMLWILVTLVYVSAWLAFGMVLSVVARSAATSALVGFGMWAFLTFLGGFVVQLIQNILAPLAGITDVTTYLNNKGTQELIQRFLPSTLYQEASIVLLNPQVMSRDLSTPTTIGGISQAQQQIPSILSLDQSFILIWPQVVALVAVTVAFFAIAYVRFMRQEVRA